MLQKNRPRRKRRLSLIITFVDFVIIFAFVFYMNQVLSKIKKIEHDDLKIKYKYDKLKDNVGYIFSLSIINNGRTNKKMKKDNNVKFFIIEKENKKLVWEKHIPKPSFPMGLSKKGPIIIKPDSHISYTYIYDQQNEVSLGKGEWRFGARLAIGTNEFKLSIPRSTKPQKGFGGFIK